MMMGCGGSVVVLAPGTAGSVDASDGMAVVLEGETAMLVTWKASSCGARKIVGHFLRVYPNER